jgi:AP endonuclease-2
MEFLQALDARIRNLVTEGKQVILVGDLNVSRSESDSTNVVETLRKEGQSIEEWMNVPSRRLFNHLIYGGTVNGDRDEGREQPVLWDLCREFHPAREGMNTCWDTKRNTRPANNGSRIDYILCSYGLKDWFTEADIQEGLMGSDHCPVFATIADVVTADEERVPLLNLMNPTGMVAKDGQRLREWHTKDVLPLSAKLIPEFDRRQSIRDMFTKSAGANQSSFPSSLAPESGKESTSGEEPIDDLARLDQDRGKTNHAHANYRPGMSDARHSAESGSLTRLGLGAPSYTKRAAGSVNRACPPSPKRNKVFDRGVNTNLGAVGRKNTKSPGNVTKGQKTLKGFFKPSTTNRTPGRRDSDASANTSTNANALLPCAQQTSTQPNEPLSSSHQAQLASPTAHLSVERNSDNWLKDSPDSVFQRKQALGASTHPIEADKAFDPIQAKESWSKLLGKRMLPRCEHNEPCISLVTKKPGVNCGVLTFFFSPPKATHPSVLPFF